MKRAAAAAVLVLFATGGRTVKDPAARPPAPAAAAAAKPVEMSDSLHWFRNSAERRAIALQTYRLASERIETAAKDKSPGSWAVILDADETVLDNSGYEVDLDRRGLTHTPELWSAFVAKKSSPAIPGAVAFVKKVKELGGRVAIVSNRTVAECPDTSANLQADGVAFDAILCKAGDGDKNPRFAQVASGAAFGALDKVEVLMWVGDNIKDFPALSQAMRSGPEEGFAAFGSRFVVLPNPMYGSWEENPKE